MSFARALDVKSTAIWATVILAAGGARPVDRIELRDGKKIEGYVLLERKDELVVLVDSRERTVQRSKVASIRSASRSLEAAFELYDQIPVGDAAGLADLARHCKDEALPGEADVFALAALCCDADNAAAHALLGHKRRKGGWFARRGGDLVPFAELLPARADLRDPWKLRTSHYALLTNLSLRDAVAIAIDLERFYGAFFELMGAEIEVSEVVVPLDVGVYGDSRSFPESVINRRAYFDPKTAQVVIDASAVEPRTSLIHEATHQLLHATAVNTRAGLGEIPGWVDEGLAEYLSASLRGEGGHARFDLGAIAEHHFTAHRDAKEPYDLPRVLQFASGDFLGSSRMDLKYAQSYTLVHFFLHAEQRRYRGKFFAFLKSAYAGSASTTDFKSVVDVPEKELEAAWKTHVLRPMR